MYSVCRTCLATTGNFFDIFQPGPEFEAMADAIMECASVKISPDDKLSLQICDGCFSKLQIAHQFRTTCIQADETLRKKAELDSIVPEIKQETTVYSDKSESCDENNEVVHEEISTRTRSSKQKRNGVNNLINKKTKTQRKKRPRRFKKKSCDTKVIETDDTDDDRVCKIEFDNPEPSFDENVVDEVKDEIKTEMCESTPEIVNDQECENDPLTDELNIEDTEDDTLDKVKKWKKTPRCHLCNKEYKNKTNLHLHILWHLGQKLYECEICNKKLRTKATLLNHKALMHSEGIPRPVNKDLKKRFKCELCDFKCTHNCNLKKHMLIHKGERNFMCEFCGKTFSGQGNLIQHRRTHTGERPHSCDVCGKSFMEPCQLRRHVSSVHDKQRPHECSVCGKRFALFGSIKPHMRVHTGERTFACDLCDKTFARSSSLRVHRRIHTGEKPYVCGVCGRKFTQKPPLNVHMRTQHLFKAA